VDCAAAHRGIPVLQASSLRAPGSRQHLWTAVRSASHGLGPGAKAHSSPFALAESFRRALDRLHPTRVPRPRSRAPRTPPASRANRIFPILSPSPPPQSTGPRLSSTPAHRTSGARQDYRSASGWRSPPPLYPAGCLKAGLLPCPSIHPLGPRPNCQRTTADRVLNAGQSCRTLTALLQDRVGDQSLPISYRPVTEFPLPTAGLRRRARGLRRKRRS
jgi:hypothetical protein